MKLSEVKEAMPEGTTPAYLLDLDTWSKDHLLACLKRLGFPCEGDVELVSDWGEPVIAKFPSLVLNHHIYDLDMTDYDQLEVSREMIEVAKRFASYDIEGNLNAGVIFSQAPKITLMSYQVIFNPDEFEEFQYNISEMDENLFAFIKLKEANEITAEDRLFLNKIVQKFIPVHLEVYSCFTTIDHEDAKNWLKVARSNIFDDTFYYSE